MFKKIIAFTVSEILIVSAIVAVVAALAVPNMKKSQDRSALAAKAKASMAKLDAAIHQVKLNDALNGKTTAKDRSDAVLSEMANYLKLAAYCGKQEDTLCFTTSVTDASNTIGGSGKPIANKDCATATLNDGSAFAVCITNYPPTSTNTFNIKDYYGYVLVDVDGPDEGLNTRAKDIYAFVISNDGLVLPQQGGVSSQEGYEDAVFDSAANIE